MPNVAEQYSELGKGGGIAPSGMTFKWRRPTNVQKAKILKGIPTLEFSTTKMTPEMREKSHQINRNLAQECVYEPLLLAKPPENGDDPGPWMLLDDVYDVDLNWIVDEMNKPNPLHSAQADAARGAL